MARTIKKPEERKEEILDAAIEVFIQKGFEKATINDIIAKKNISHGIVYHYFKSKDEILEVLFDTYLDTIIKEIVEPVIADKELNSLEKLNIILQDEFGFSEKPRTYIYKFRLIKDRLIRQKYSLKFFEKYVPAIFPIVKQGIKEGYFNVKYPVESIKFVVFGFFYFFDPSINRVDEEEYKNIIDAAPSIIESILNAKKGSFDFLKDFLTLDKVLETK